MTDFVFKRFVDRVDGCNIGSRFRHNIATTRVRTPCVRRQPVQTVAAVVMLTTAETYSIKSAKYALVYDLASK